MILFVIVIFTACVYAVLCGAAWLEDQQYAEEPDEHEDITHTGDDHIARSFHDCWN